MKSFNNWAQSIQFGVKCDYNDKKIIRFQEKYENAKFIINQNTKNNAKRD